MVKSRYIFQYILSVLVITIIFSFSATAANDFDIGVEAGILIEAETGQVLFAKNIDKQMPPASITKIMALLIAMEQVEKGAISLDDEVTISEYAQAMGGSQIYLAADTRVKLRDLLKAVAVASANDASVAVAEAIAGTYGNFIDWMNKKAEELGMENTHFVNSTGLPTEHGEHYSTPEDIAIMARELVKYPQVLAWASIWHETLQLPNRKASLTNTNELIKKKTGYPGMDGLKTGHTDEAGYCLAATAKRNNMRLISVVMKADSVKERKEMTSRLLDYGFNAFSKDIIVEKNSEVQNIDVSNGKQTVTSAAAARDLYVVIKRGTKDTLEKEVILKEDISAPIIKGEVLGEKLILQNGKILAKVKLLATEDIEKANIFIRLWRGFVNWIGSVLQNIFG